MAGSQRRLKDPRPRGASADEEPKHRGRREVAADAKKAAILEGARSVFLEYGYGGASMTMIATSSGVSKMTLYRHFENKEQLFNALMEDLCRQLIGHEAMRQMEELPPDQALRLYGRRMLSIVFSPDVVGIHRVVVSENKRFPEIARIFYESIQISINMLGAYLEKHRQHPRLKLTDPRKNAEEFMSLLRGYTHLRILLGLETAPFDVAEAVDSAVKHLLR